MLASSLVGTFISFVLGMLNPKILNKAGPDWLWMGGREDVVDQTTFADLVRESRQRQRGYVGEWTI